MTTFCVERDCSPWACVGFLQVLPPTVQRYMQLRLIGSSTLPTGVNGKVSARLLCRDRHLHIYFEGLVPPD